MKYILGRRHGFGSSPAASPPHAGVREQAITQNQVAFIILKLFIIPGKNFFMMRILKNKKYLLLIVSGIILVLAAGIFLLLDNHEEEITPVTPSGPPSGFTFFDIGANTRFTKEIRESLEAQLGSDVLETNTIIDLSVNYNGFLKKFFPNIHRLNVKLIDSSGARIEHNTIKLTYRYALRKNTPFYYVELVFSNYVKLPLYFMIKSKKEGAEIIDAFNTKYGEANKIDWAGEKGSALYWKENNDILLVSKLKDRFGLPEYHITMYFVENINQLISLEDKVKTEREASKKKAGKTAF